VSGSTDERRAARRPRSRGVSAERPSGRPPTFWISAAVGWALIAWGVRGTLLHRLDTRPAQLLRFFATGLVAHDGLFAPAVLLGGAVLARTVRAPWRAPVQAALLVAGSAALYAYPLVRGYGHVLHNPTSLPRDYTAGLAVVVGLVVIAALTGALIGRRGTQRGRAACRRGPGPHGPPGDEASQGRALRCEPGHRR